MTKVPAFSLIIGFVSLFILGLFMIPRLSIKLNPSKTIPVVNVSFSMHGQSARVIEMEVTSKLEAMLSRVKGVQGVSSYSSNGSGNVTIRLSKHIDPEMARFEVSTIIRQAWSSLPPGVSYPSIYMSGAGEERNYPFLRYTVNAPLSPIQIQEYINDNIKPEIADVKGVDRIDVYGAGRMIYKLEYNYPRLRSLNVSIDDIRSAIRSYLTKEFLGLGKVEDESSGEQWIRVALVSEDKGRAFDPSLIHVKKNEGNIIYLNQVVNTTYEEEETSSYYRINGLNSINLVLTAEKDANQLSLSKQIRKRLTEMQSGFPSGFELHLSYDAGEYIQEEINKICFRSGLTVLILLCFVLLFYRNWRYSLLIISSLVANIVIAAIFYYLFRLELQLFSLAGLTISLTLIIDNVIIMSDQIIRQGNRKAFMAIFTTTVTTIGSLAIILFMDENIRANLEDFVWVIIINLTVSMFIALFFVPALIEKMGIEKRLEKTKKKKKKRAFRKRLLVHINRAYQKVIIFISKKKGWFIALIILAFGLPVFLLPDRIEKKSEYGYYSIIAEEDLGFWAKLYNQSLGSAFYKEHIKPVSDVALGGTMRLFAQKVDNGSYSSGEREETSLNVAASLPNGSTKEQMDALIKKMESYIRQYPEVRQFETYIENGRRASIRILFEKEHQRSSFPYMLKNKLISKAVELGGGSWSVYGLGDGFNNDVTEHAGSMRVKLLGYNYDELNALAETMRDSLLQHRRVKEVTIDSKFSWYKNDYMEFTFDLDKERLARLSILPVDLFHSLNPMFERNARVGDWVQENRIEPIRLFSKQADELDVWNLENYPGQAKDKGYRLTEISGIEKSTAPQDIAKENQQYRLCLQYEYIGAYQQAWKVTERMIDMFNQTSSLGYKAESDIPRFWWKEDGNAQYLLLFLIILIIFFTTSILFNSLTQPLVVLFSIPVSFIGLFLTFYLFELNFDQGGFAAFILLTGISVNANIYLLNEYNNIRRVSPHLKPIKAYIKAWNAKMRPIFLTIISTVLGFIPFIIGYKESFWYPLALGTIGGLIMSLIGVFFFFPLFMNVTKSKL